MARETLRTPATPCASCPYRKDVPSGVWDWEEYEKLRQYDEDPTDPTRAIGHVFLCHQPIENRQAVCRGWVEVHYDTIPVRMAMASGAVDPATVQEPPPGVELFESGAAAADHGQAEIETPCDDARSVMAKIEARRQR